MRATLTFVPKQVVRHVYRLLVGDPESVIQDRLPEVPRDVVVADALRYRVVPRSITTSYNVRTKCHTQVHRIILGADIKHFEKQPENPRSI